MFSRILPIHSAGGMQDHVQTLSAGLVRKGHEVIVITTAHHEAKEFETIDGVAVYFLNDAPLGRNTNEYWFNAARKFEELHATQPFDLLHSQSVGAYGVWKRSLHRKYHLPLITSFHGTHLDVFTTSWHTDFALTNPLGIARFFAISIDLFYRYLARDVWFTRGSDILIATSDADVWKYQKLYGAQVARIRKVYNGIDTHLFAPLQDVSALRASLKIREDEKILLALARLQKDKGVQNAIVVMPRLLKEINARLIVVGDGDYRSSLEALAREQGVADHVNFIGTKSLAECADYFNVCDIFVDPTLRTDGYDLTIAEAMACGKPVIVSDVGANSTLIDAATMRDGILIPRGDNEALTRQILRVLGDQKLAQSMGELGRQKIAARFSIEAMVDGMEQVYREQLKLKICTV
ncbi:MAG: glycosyltransferase family 4 protein [Chloroflexi bacterium]|nr:glycosyltransferase family 4 protein [Chloroflexota bacterium]